MRCGISVRAGWMAGVLLGLAVVLPLRPCTAEPVRPNIQLGGGPFFGLSDDGFVWGTITVHLDYDTNRPAPLVVKAIPPLENVVAIGAGVAVDQSGRLWLWTGSEPRARVVSGLDGVLAAARSPYYALAVKRDGTVWSWRPSSRPGSLDEEQPREIVQVAGVADAVGVDAGPRFGLAVTRAGTVWKWNETAPGAKGGIVEARGDAAQVAGLSDIVSVAAGEEHGLALARDGSVWAFGSNSRGQLGDGTLDPHESAIHVRELKDVVAIAAGARHSVALRRDGTVWTWGMNEAGQLGSNARIDRWEPGQMQGIDQVVAVATGASVTVALRRDGSVWSSTSGPVPARVPGLQLVRREGTPAVASPASPPPTVTAKISPSDQAEIGRGELAQTIAYLASPDKQTRYQAARKAATLPDARSALPALDKLAREDPDTMVRSAALSALARIDGDDRATVSLLVDTLANPALQLIAVQELHRLGPRAAAEVLGALASEDPAVRVRAAEALKGTDLSDQNAALVDRALTALMSGLSSTDPMVRDQSAQSIAVLGPQAKRAVPLLVRALADNDRHGYYVRVHAAAALGAIGPGAESAVPALTALLHDDLGLGSAARQALQRIGTPEALAAAGK